MDDAHHLLRCLKAPAREQYIAFLRPRPACWKDSTPGKIAKPGLCKVPVTQVPIGPIPYVHVSTEILVLGCWARRPTCTAQQAASPG